MRKYTRGNGPIVFLVLAVGVWLILMGSWIILSAGGNYFLDTRVGGLLIFVGLIVDVCGLAMKQ